MILEKLKTWEYYQSKIPLFLKNSYGMDEHFKIFFDILKNCDEISDEILSGFDLFNKNYEKKYIEKYENLNLLENNLVRGLNLNGKTILLDSIDNVDKIDIRLDDSLGVKYAIVWTGSAVVKYDDNANLIDTYYENNKWIKNEIYFGRDSFIISLSNECLNMKYTEPDRYSLDILDKIGKIYGINRYFDVKYIAENGQETTKQLKLTNKELYKLILSKIILLNYDGTYEMARELYNKIGLPIYMITDNSANVKLILDTGNETTITQNIKDLFYANLFTLKSLGITYTIFEADITKLAVYDSDDENLAWDNGVWS